ncbi:MAG: pantetheine-phosphate adenylyltransferase [Lachnospiraceae bacterium]
MRKAIYQGSFDPITYGHIDIIKRAAAMFDEVTVAILLNPNKTALFSLEERVTMIKEALKDVAHVRIDSFEGLVVEYARAHDIEVSVRGVRSMIDFEYEAVIAQNNTVLSNGTLDTCLLLTDPRYAHISSSGVKEIAKFKGDLTTYVPDHIAIKIQEKYKDM